MSTAISWRLTPGQQLRRRQWDGECVLYNDLSGDTHLLGADALELLLALLAGPADAGALARGLLAAGLEADGVAGVDALLADLEGLALVEAVC